MKNFLNQGSMNAIKCPNGTRVVINFSVNAELSNLIQEIPDNIGACKSLNRQSGKGTMEYPFEWDCIDGNAIAVFNIKQSSQITTPYNVTAIINLPKSYKEYYAHHCGVLIQQTEDDGTPIPTEEEDESMLTANAGIGIGIWC